MSKLIQLSDSSGDVYPITQFGELLWTNPSPTATFTNQEITLDLSPYSYLFVVTRASTSNANASVSILANGQGTAIQIDSSADVLAKRGCSYTDTYINFQVGVKYGLLSLGASVDNNVAIPLVLYGIR